MIHPALSTPQSFQSLFIPAVLISNARQKNSRHQRKASNTEIKHQINQVKIAVWKKLTQLGEVPSGLDKNDEHIPFVPPLVTTQVTHQKIVKGRY